MSASRKIARKSLRVSRNPLRVLVWSAAVVLIVPTLAVVVLHLPWVQTRVIEHLVQRIETTSNLQIELQGYRSWPFSRLRLLNLKVRSLDKELLQCEQAQLTYHLSWTWPYLHPKELFLQKPTLHLEKDSQGRWQLPATGESGDSGWSSGSAKWLQFPWPKVRIVSGEIFAHQDGRLILSLRNITGVLSLQAVSGPDGPRLKIDLGNWQGLAETPDWGNWEIEGKAELHNQVLALDALTISISDKSTIRCQGQWMLTPPYNGKAAIQLAPLSRESFPELGSRFAQLREVSGSLDLNRRDGIWVVDHQLHGDPGDLDGTLELDTQGGTTVARWTTGFAEVKIPTTQEVPESSLRGQLNLSLQGNDIRTMQAQLQLRLESSQVAGQLVKYADITASYKNGTVDLQSSDIESFPGKFSVAVLADLNGLWDPQHEGALSGTLEVERADLARLGSSAQQQAAGALHFKARYAAGKMRDWLQWHAQVDGDLNLPGFLSLKTSGTYLKEVLDVDYDLEVNELQKFSDFRRDWDGRGRLASRGTFKGKWPDLVWEGNVEAQEFQLGQIESSRASLKGKGRITGKEAQRQLSVKAQNVVFKGENIGSLQAVLEQQDDVCRFQVSGTQIRKHGSLQLSGQLTNMWSSPQLLIVEKGQLQWEKQSAALDGRVELEERRFVIRQFNLSRGKQVVRIDGELIPDDRVDLKLNCEDLDLAQWLPALGIRDVLTGQAAGQARVSGHPGTPQVDIDLQLTNGAWNHKEKVDRILLQGSYVRDELQVKGELHGLAGAADPVKWSARVPVAFSLSPLRFELKRREQCSASLQLVGLDTERLLPHLDFLDQLGGRLAGEVIVSGLLEAPVIRGSGSWSKGRFRVKAWPHPIENVQLQWVADSRQIQIQKADVRLFGGPVAVTGKVNYPRFDEMEFEALGKDLDVSEFYGIQGRAAGKMRFAKGVTGAEWTGDLNLSRAKVNLGDLETDLAKNIEVIEGEDKGDLLVISGDEHKQDTFYNKLQIDLSFKLPASGTPVRGKGLEAEINGSLRITKDQFAPLKFYGSFQTIRGIYRFQGNELKIVEGELVFLGLPQPDPNLKIVCQKDLRDVTIQIQVSGPASQPKLALSSIPAMNQVDILSYLLFGQPAGRLSSRESFQLQDKAATWMGSEASRVLKGALGNTPFAPDVLQYRGSDEGEGGVIEIGKHITPDLSVTYEKGIMGQESNQVDLEYRLNRHLSIQTQVGAGEQSGVDVFWRHDFGK